MTDITYDKAAAAAPAQAAPRKGFWRLVFEAMVAARMRQAEQIVKDYRALRS